jgi:hypothetical protein
MKFTKILALCGLASSIAATAQSGYTAASGNLAGVCYQNGSIQAAWQNGNPTAPVLPTLNGSPFNQYIPNNIDSNGNFALNLGDVAIIQPNSPNLSSWNITACAKGGSQPKCFTALNVPVTGASMNLNSYFAGATSACTGGVTEVNSTPLASQSPVNFIDSSVVKFTNPAFGQVTANLQNIPNADLINSQTTVNGVPCILGGTCTVSAAGATPAYIGTLCHGSTTGSTTSGTLVLTCPGVVAGDALLLPSYIDQTLNAFNSTAISVTDSQGNTWTQPVSRYGWQFSLGQGLFLALANSSGTDVITLTATVTGASGSINLFYGQIDEFSGVNGVFPVVQNAQGAVVSGSTSVPIASKPTQSGDLLYSANVQQGNTSETYFSTGYTVPGAATNCPNQGVTNGCAGSLYAVSNSATPALWSPTIGWTNSTIDSGISLFVELAAATNPNPVLSQYPPAGIPLATGNTSSPWGASYAPQGTDTHVMTSGTVAGTGASLCLDANGGATTAGCSGGGSFVITQTDETSSRAFGTVYQNTTGYPLMIQGFALTGGSSVGNLSCFNGPTSSPSNQLWGDEATATVSLGELPFFFTVPVSWYYKCTENGAVGAIGYWFETQMGH